MNEIEEILLKKVPILDDRYIKVQRLDFVDFEELKEIDKELNLLRNKYVELRSNLFEIDKTKGNIEIENILQTKNKLRKNHILDLKEAIYCWGPERWR